MTWLLPPMPMPRTDVRPRRGSRQPRTHAIPHSSRRCGSGSLTTTCVSERCAAAYVAATCCDTSSCGSATPLALLAARADRCPRRPQEEAQRALAEGRERAEKLRAEIEAHPDPVFMYGGQRLKHSELQMQRIRNRVARDKRATYTYSMVRTASHRHAHARAATPMLAPPLPRPR